MSQMNHTPLDDNTLQQLADPSNEPSKTQETSVTVSVSPESGPVRIETPQKDDVAPENSNPEENTEQAPSSETSQPQNYVDKKIEDIELPPELKNLGLKAVKQADFPDYQNVQLPISDEKVIVGTKAPITSSVRWLAEFAKFLLWKAHITLKTVHGRVIRVVRK